MFVCVYITDKCRIKVTFYSEEGRGHSGLGGQWQTSKDYTFGWADAGWEMSVNKVWEEDLCMTPQAVGIGTIRVGTVFASCPLTCLDMVGSWRKAVEVESHVGQSWTKPRMWGSVFRATRGQWNNVLRRSNQTRLWKGGDCSAGKKEGVPCGRSWFHGPRREWKDGCIDMLVLQGHLWALSHAVPSAWNSFPSVMSSTPFPYLLH